MRKMELSEKVTMATGSPGRSVAWGAGLGQWMAWAQWWWGRSRRSVSPLSFSVASVSSMWISFRSLRILTFWIQLAYMNCQGHSGPEVTFRKAFLSKALLVIYFEKIRHSLCSLSMAACTHFSWATEQFAVGGGQWASDAEMGDSGCSTTVLWLHREFKF